MKRAPRFWRRRLSPAALALWPASKVWGAITGFRLATPPPFAAPLPVICAGSFTVGGDGKTPLALALAERASTEGYRAGFLSRGHGGAETGPVLVRPDHRAADVGDEPLLLAAAGPTIVSRDRAAGARLLATIGVDLIIMDDGFQNAHLRRDFSFVVVDAEAGFGNRFVLPAGPLRAPLRGQLERADAVILVGEGRAVADVSRRVAAAGRTLLRARLVPVAGARPDAPVLAYAGIGRPEKFFAALVAAGHTVAERRVFPDHHPFTAADAEALVAEAGQRGLALITTEKDLARLRGLNGALGRLREASRAFAVRMEFDDEAMIRRLVRLVVERVRRTRLAP